MDQRQGTADLLVLQGAQPPRLRGGVAGHPGADRLQDQQVRQARDEHLAAGPQCRGFCGHQAQGMQPPLLEHRHVDGPRRRERRTAVEAAAHAQEVQRLAERVHRPEKVLRFHGGEYRRLGAWAPGRPQMQDLDDRA